MEIECIRCGGKMLWNEKDFPLCKKCEEELLQEEISLNQAQIEREKNLVKEQERKRYDIYENVCLNRYLHNPLKP